MTRRFDFVFLGVVVCAVAAACGSLQPSAQGTGSPAADVTVGDATVAVDLKTVPVPPVGSASPPPSVPARLDGEQDLQWGHQPDGTIVLDGDRTSIQSLALDLRSTGKLAFTPALPAGIDVGPTVYGSEFSGPGVYDALVIEYASPSNGFFGIWERPAADGEADTYVTKRIDQCAPPAECRPAMPKKISLDNGTRAALIDPGGITWVQNGTVFMVAGPWAEFGAERSVPLANAVAAASDAFVKLGG